jgi:hypothetical protein
MSTERQRWNNEEWLLFLIWLLIPMMFAIVTIRLIILETPMEDMQLELFGNLSYTILGILAGSLGTKVAIQGRIDKANEEQDKQGPDNLKQL